MFQIEKPSVCLNPCVYGHRVALSKKEHTLGARSGAYYVWRTSVLILVLMEDTLGEVNL